MLVSRVATWPACIYRNALNIWSNYIGHWTLAVAKEITLKMQHNLVSGCANKMC